MYFSNLTLTGFSYEKGDQSITIEELTAQGLPKYIVSRNPVPETFVYQDDSQWTNRLTTHVKYVTKMANVEDKDIQGFWGVHNGYNNHPEGASPWVMAAIDNPKGFMNDFNLGCASVILAAQLAGLHFSDTAMNNVLVGMVQLNTQYTNLCTDGNCILADSIGALMFSKQDEGNMIKYTQIDSSSYFRDMFVIDENTKYQIQNLHKGKELNEFMVKSFGSQMLNGCKAMQTYPVDLDYIAISCSNYAASKMVLEALNFPLERTGIDCLKKVPHMGTNDLIYQLEHGIEEGMIKNGSKILVTGTSFGFSVATMAIEWGS
jgi:3-oxoacyl-[acyl-carrier-protein] synthase III